METEFRRVESATASYVPEMARIVDVRALTGSETLYQIRLENGRELGHEPGQFVQVALLGIGEAPISICSSPTQKGFFELCVRRVGLVTTALRKFSPGDPVGIRGPFGHGFPLDRLRGKDLILVAGGLGLAPMRSLINYVLDRRNEFGEVHILFGTRSPDDILFKNEVLCWLASNAIKFSMTVDVADTSWRGNVGVVTTLMRDLPVKPDRTAAVIVGPPVMYKFVVRELLSLNINVDDIYLSLERRMKCGMGKCGHCQINHVYVCQEGPCFPYRAILSMPEAI